MVLDKDNCQLTNGDYEVALQEVRPKVMNGKHASWEMLMDGKVGVNCLLGVALKISEFYLNLDYLISLVTTNYGGFFLVFFTNKNQVILFHLFLYH